MSVYMSVCMLTNGWSECVNRHCAILKQVKKLGAKNGNGIARHGTKEGGGVRVVAHGHVLEGA